MPVTPEKLAELKRNASGILANCRQSILRAQPFIGNVAMKLEIVPVRDVRCPTACTDGKRVYFDIAFLASLSENERKFVLAHELWHCVMLHFARRQTREIELFNIATDMEVNQIVKKDGFIAPSKLVWPKSYGLPDDRSAEEYYELLLKMAKSKKSGNANGDGGCNGFSGQFDKHMFEGDMFEPANGMTATDKYGEKGEDEEFQPNVSKDAVEKMRENVISSAMQAAKSDIYRGKLPAHIQGIVDELRKPEIRWQEVLAQFVTRTIGEKRTWTRPNRRFISSRMYLPSSYGDKLRVAVGIDTSGSCVDSLPKFLGELNSLVKTFGNYELTIIQCDTKVDKVDVYDECNPLDLEHQKFEASGYGGTTLHPIFDYIALNNVEADAIVIFTDGCIEHFPKADAPDIPTLWAITKGGTTEEIEFGETIKMEES